MWTPLVLQQLLKDCSNLKLSCTKIEKGVHLHFHQVETFSFFSKFLIPMARKSCILFEVPVVLTLVFGLNCMISLYDVKLFLLFTL